MTLKNLITFYQEQNYFSSAMAESLLQENDAYLPLIAVIYVHINACVGKIKKQPRIQPITNILPIYLKDMFIENREAILQLLDIEPLAITKLLSFSRYKSTQIVFANPLIYQRYVNKVFDLDTVLYLTENQLEGLTQLDDIFDDFTRANIDIMPALGHLQIKTGVSVAQLVQIANILVKKDDKHRLVIIQQLFECKARNKLAFITELLQEGSINNDNIKNLISCIYKSRIKGFEGLVSFTKRLNRRLTVEELVHLFHKKVDLLINFYSDILRKLYPDYNDKSNDINLDYWFIWQKLIEQSLLDPIKGYLLSNNSYLINANDFHRCWQLYSSVPESVFSVMALFANKANPSREVKNLTSVSVYHFLFYGDLHEAFEKIIKLTDTQRANFESSYIVLLLKNKVITVEKVLSMATWQREYLEIWMSTLGNNNLEATRNFVLTLDHLDKDQTKARIKTFFDQEYQLDRDMIPLSQRKNISCAELRLFFRGKDKEQLLYCEEEQLNDIKQSFLRKILGQVNVKAKCLYCLPQDNRVPELLADHLPIFQRLANHFNPLQQHQPIVIYYRQLDRRPLVRTTLKQNTPRIINYGQSTHNSVVEASTAESLKKIREKYQPQEINNEEIYLIIAEGLLKEFCQKRGGALLARYNKEMNNDSNNKSHRIAITHEDRLYLFVNALFKLSKIPQKTEFLNQIILVLTRVINVDQYLKCFSFVYKILMDTCYISTYQAESESYFFNPTEQHNVETNWSTQCDTEALLEQFNTLLSTQDITVPATNNMTTDPAHLNMRILAVLSIGLNIDIMKSITSEYNVFQRQIAEQQQSVFKVPVTETIKWRIVLKMFLYLNPLKRPIYLTEENTSLLSYFWLELQEECPKVSANAIEILLDALFEIGSTYSLDQDEKNIILAQRTKNGILYSGGFIASCPGGASNKFIEKLTSISPLVEICYVTCDLIKMRIEQLLVEHSIRYLQSLPMSQQRVLLCTMKQQEADLNLDPPISTIWQYIYPDVRDSLIIEFSKTNPGVQYLRDELPISVTDKEKYDYQIFKNCVNSYGDMSFDVAKIESAIETQQSANRDLMIDEIIRDKVAAYHQRLTNVAQLSTADEVWSVLKNEVISAIISQLEKNYPGIAALDTLSASSSRKPSVIEANNLRLFQTYLNDNAVTVIKQTLNNLMVDEESSLVIRPISEPKANDEPPKKRHRSGFFSQHDDISEFKTPPASPPSSPSV